MYIVDRMTQFKPTEQKTMSGEGAPGQSGDRANCAYADPLCGFEWESVSNKCVKQKITPQEDEGIEEKKKGIDIHPTHEVPSNFSAVDAPTDSITVEGSHFSQAPNSTELGWRSHSGVHFSSARRRSSVDPPVCAGWVKKVNP